jgi:hypothetical protein
MSFFKKIKSIIPSLKKRKKTNSACDALLEIIISRERKLNSRPEHISKDEWKYILNTISSGIKYKKNQPKLVSPRRQYLMKEKIKEAFRLLEKHISEL